MILKVRNTLPEESQKTNMTHLEASGVTALRWKNPNVFAASWGIQIGETGEERSEIRLLGTATPAGTAGTITAATSYEHPADTPIYAIKYDQVVFEVSTSGTAGTAVPITDGTITIQPDSEFTVFDHTTGLTTYAYKTKFRNSVLTSESTESDWITSGGFSFYSLAKLRQRAKDKLWNPDFVSDDTLDDWINEWLQEMVQTAVEVNEDYSLGTVDVAVGTDGRGTITNGDFKSIRQAWLSNNGSDYYRCTKAEMIEFFPNQVFNNTNPYFFMRGDNNFEVKPAGTGTVQIHYYSSGTQITSDTDELPVYMRGYTKSFVDYAYAQALYKDHKDGDKPYLKAEAAKQRFKMDLSPRSQTGNTMVSIVDSIEEDIVI